MAVVHRGESTTGPVAVDGRTITLVARTRALRVGGPLAGLVHVRSRPAHVEVLDGEGRRSVVRIRDVEGALTALIVAGAATCIIGTRAWRRTR